MFDSPDYALGSANFGVFNPIMSPITPQFIPQTRLAGNQPKGVTQFSLAMHH